MRENLQGMNNSVDSLLSISVNTLASYLEVHVDTLKMLPRDLKSRLLSVATKRGKLSDKALKHLLHPEVLKLNLSECAISDETIQDLSICKVLHKLDINPGRNQFHDISPTVLVSLFPNLPHLTILYMHRCVAVTDDVIATVAKHCQLLKELDVGGCSRITDTSLKKLKDLKNLTCLKVSSSQVSDRGVCELVEGDCGETLTELHVDSCPHITDFGIERIVLFCSNMKVLIFHGCPVTDVSWRALEQLLRKSRVQQLTWTVY